MNIYKIRFFFEDLTQICFKFIFLLAFAAFPLIPINIMIGPAKMQYFFRYYGFAFLTLTTVFAISMFVRELTFQPFYSDRLIKRRLSLFFLVLTVPLWIIKAINLFLL